MEQVMGSDPRDAQPASLERELDESEAFVQRLRAYITAIRDALAAGQSGRALSMCHQALTELDGATDVAAPSQHLKEEAGLDSDFPKAT